MALLLPLLHLLNTLDNGTGGTFNTSSPPQVPQVKPEEITANIGGEIVRGEMKKWHKVTLMLDSPIGSERGGTSPLPNGARAPNLFADYGFQVDFYHAISGTSVSVPGHFAVNGQAATTGAVSGHVWDCYFRPMHTGLWQYTVRFKYGIDAAITTVDGPTTGSNATTATSALFFLWTIWNIDKFRRNHRRRKQCYYSFVRQGTITGKHQCLYR
jgi:Domain of unknown function (DUF5060)